MGKDMMSIGNMLDGDSGWMGSKKLLLPQEIKHFSVKTNESGNQ